ncbi:MAG: vWA domain-containing protein [Thermacetogeniaceae bacterium]
MVEKILEFSRLLRKGGINVSLSQITAAIRAVAEIGFHQEDFYHALACTMITEKVDKPLFDKLFRLFFYVLPESDVNKRKEESNLSESELDATSQTSILVKSVEGFGQGRGGGASPAALLVKAVREGNYPLLERLAQIAFRSIEPLRRENLSKLEELIVQAKVSIGWYEAVNRLERIKEKEKINEITYSKWQECLNYLETRIKEYIEDFFVKTFGEEALEEIVSINNLKQKEFYQLNNIEVDEIKKRITKLARKLASKYARRYRRAKHGEIDLRRTVKNALKTGGTPIRLGHRKKKLSKPEIVLLCDVSGSVAIFSEFMLQLVYTIQNRFKSVRSFLFVDRIEEVTNYFQGEDIEIALQKAFSNANFSSSGFSDYGKVFTIFATKYLHTISPRSTVIILGDARNNWRADEREYLKLISESVRKVLWFNPQPQIAWDTEDSIMKIYAPYCRQVFECRNLAQLEEVIEAIL